MKNKITFYEVLVFIAYGFFTLFGGAWFFISWSSPGHPFNYLAFFILVAFGIQFYFRHRLTNLILGVLALSGSIWMLLDVINLYNLMDKHAHADAFGKGFIWFGFVSIIMSVILIFGYTKLSFKDR